MNKRTVKTNWRIYERSEVYPQCMSHYLDLLRQKKGRGQFKYLANHYEIIAYSRLKQGQYFWWARDIDQLKKTTSVWIKEWIRKRSSFEEIKKIFYISRQKFKKDFSKVEKQLIKAKSSREFYKLYSAIKQSCFEHILFSEYTVDTFDDFFGDFFAEYLFKASDNKISQVEISDLGQSVYLSESLNYKKEILKLSLKEKTAIKNMKKIVARYEWIMMSWDGKNIITEATILKDIKKVRQQSLDSRKSEIKKIDNFSRDVIKRRKFLLKKYHFSLKEINKYFSLLDYFTKFHDWRKEIQMRANKVIFSVLK